MGDLADVMTMAQVALFAMATHSAKRRKAMERGSRGKVVARASPEENLPS